MAKQMKEIEIAEQCLCNCGIANGNKAIQFKKEQLFSNTAAPFHPQLIKNRVVMKEDPEDSEGEEFIGFPLL